MVPPQVHVEPAHDQWQRRVCAARDQEQRAVLGAVVDGRQQDGEAGDRDTAAGDGEGVTVTRAVRDEGDQHGKTEGGGPWWHGMDCAETLDLAWRSFREKRGEKGSGRTLRLHGAVAECRDDGGREEGVAVGRYNEAEVHEARDNDYQV